MEARKSCSCAKLVKQSRWLLIAIALAIALIVLVSGCLAQEFYDDDNIEDEIGLNTSQVINQRGYVCIEITIITDDDYALNLVECRNPLVNYSDPAVADKIPVLFVHGTLYNATCFVTDTPKPAGPKDFSRYNASQMSESQLAALYVGSPNKESLVFILLDFGHKVYLLNRRFTIASQRAYDQVHGTHIAQYSALSAELDAVEFFLSPISPAPGNNPVAEYIESLGLASNSSYWNFSLDDQAAYDLAPCFKYILANENRSTLAAIGWSSGGAILEMALSTQPLLNEQLSKTLLWSPAFYLGQTYRDAFLYSLVSPFLNNYIGPFPSQFFADVIGYTGVNLCSTELTQETICEAVVDFIGGYGDGRQLLKPGFFNSAPAPTSSHEFAQLGKASVYGKMHVYQNPAQNSTKPALYDAAKITTPNLYFWGASYDALVSIEDVARNVADLKINATFIRLDQPGIFFEHLSYVWHKNKSSLLYFPSLRILESRATYLG